VVSGRGTAPLCCERVTYTSDLSLSDCQRNLRRSAIRWHVPPTSHSRPFARASQQNKNIAAPLCLSCPSTAPHHHLLNRTKNGLLHEAEFFSKAHSSWTRCQPSYCRIHTNPPLDPILSQLNALRTLMLHCFDHFSIILPSATRVS
jgi:hypothetical protein